MCPRSSCISFHIFIWQGRICSISPLWTMIEFVLLLASTNKSAAKKSMVGWELPVVAWVCDCLWTLSSLINHHVLLETHWTSTKSQQPVWSEAKHTIFLPTYFCLIVSKSIQNNLALFFSTGWSSIQILDFHLKIWYSFLKEHSTSIIKRWHVCLQNLESNILAEQCFDLKSNQTAREMCITMKNSQILWSGNPISRNICYRYTYKYTKSLL